MRGLWQSSSCVGVLALVMLAQPASAERESDVEYEMLWVDKSLNTLQHAKRKAVCQLDGWSLCPASVGGGCCPNNFKCDTASCFATTAGPTTCNGKVGYYSCPITAGAGSCCPVGLICGDGHGCLPPPGVSISQSCPANYFRCPDTFGGGCCPEGRVCGSDICYANTPKTLPVSETKTITNSEGHTTITVVMSTEVITDGPPLLSGSPAASVVPQFIPSTVAKIGAVQTNDSGGSNGGLSSGALGGIVAGVVVIFIFVAVAATFIILRLRRAEKATKSAEQTSESRRDPSNSQPRSHKSGFEESSISQIDSTTDMDTIHQFPIMQPSPQLRSRSTTYGSADHSPSPTPNFNSSDTSSPPLWGAPFNYASSIVSDGRQSSLDSYPRYDNGPVRTSQSGSVDSQGPYAHSRQPSDTSELEESHGVSELENNDTVLQRQPNSTTRPGKGHVRRSSDHSSQNRARGNSSAGSGALGTVNETLELYGYLPGYYGPEQTATGRTSNRNSSPANEAPSQQHP